MSGVKQAMTQAIHSENLTPGADPGQQHDVERLTALGLVGTESLRARLGTLLLRLDAGDLGCRQEAIAVLSSWLAKHREVERSWHLQQASSLLRLFAAMLLTEWLYPQCAACGGAGTQPQAPDLLDLPAALGEALQRRPQVAQLGRNREKFAKAAVSGYIPPQSVVRGGSWYNLRGPNKNNKQPVTRGQSRG
jgi:hypothetical protein